MFRMLEVRTAALTQAEALDFIEAACRSHQFRVVQPHWNTFALRRQALADFPGYELMPDTNIELSAKPSQFTAAEFEKFWDLLGKLRDASGLVQLRLYITESGQKFEPDQDRDLEISGGAGFAGFFLDIQVGSLSPNFTTKSHWRNVARRLWESPSAAPHLHANGKEGECSFPGRETVVLGSSSPEAVKSVCGQGRVALVPHRYAPGAIAWGLSEEHLKTALERALDPVPPAQVVAAEVNVFFSGVTQYLAALPLLNQASLAPWVVTVTARPRYSVHELSRLVEETDCFALQIFELQAPEIGRLEVEFESSGGNYYFQFRGEYGGEGQELALQKLVHELTGGRDIIGSEF